VSVGGQASNGMAFTPTPVITGVSPGSGVTGTSVTITGTGFGSLQGAVTINGVTATASSWNPNQIVVPIPSAATTGNVVVTVNQVASNGVALTVTPTITGLSSAGGAVGASVTITGTGFGNIQGTNTVSFNGVTATATSWSPNQIVVPVPAAATTGNVVVTVNQVASNGVGFTVIPTITGLSLASGPVGSSVTITGISFGTSQGTSTVTFNGVAATTINTWTANSITVIVPAGATTGNVVVTVPGGFASNGVSFTVVPPPSITSLSPNTGPVGSSIQIAGSNFGATQGTVTFNGTAATTISTWTTNSITAIVPAGVVTGNVVITVPGGVGSNGVSFTVVPAPSITSLSLNTGPVGSSIQIAGSNFSGTQGTVTFNGTAATTISTWTTSSITVIVPAGATTGNVVVTVPGGVGSNGLSFTVVPAPIITSLSLNTGAVGSSIQIAGSNFSGTQGTVMFNGTTATSISNWTTNSITVIVPAGATTGNVVVTVPGGVGSNGVSFTVVPAPSITGLSVNSGPVGTSVTITGTNLGSSQGNGSVTFNGTPATTISNWTAGSITAQVPIGAASGLLVVTAPGGVASIGVDFSVLDPNNPPTITSLTVSPPPGSKPGTFGAVVSSGPVGMGFFVNGSNFGAQQLDSTVTINGVSAKVLSWSATQILVQVPSTTIGTAFPVVVTVGTNPGQASTKNPQFTVSSPLGCN
jgi:hypothetical protein